MVKNKVLFFSNTSGAVLLLFYFTVVSIFNTPKEALYRFTQVWYWLLMLAVGFAIHIGLFTYVRIYLKRIKGWSS